MNVRDGKNALQEIFQTQQYVDFHAMLAGLASSNVDVLCNCIGALLKANGFPYVSSNFEVGNLNVWAGHIEGKLENVLIVNLKTFECGGAYVDLLSVTYRALYLIETKFSAFCYLPQDMREREINSAISEIGLTEDLYNHILNNW
ncbi:hypothetical protein [Thalassolituus sp. C2-1]|uniref:hypothetical protein n=1 Tax=Venatorbacter sp. C2-1 TaxID=2597518 RepID=UPI001190D42A|nr:hypothetical protein [Thalassolituus sp. C2-1]TVV45417.1 hypothetical protein FOT50_00845 [Thalassolituus sp. C2-1]